MNTFEEGMFSSPGEQISTHEHNIERQRQINLAEYESRLINDTDEHPWWSFFDSGVRDGKGVTWSVYNRWCDETETYGWKVVRCPEGQTEFREIPVLKVVGQEVYAATDERDGLRTFQLYIRDEGAGLTNNDVLNVLLYYNDTTLTPRLKLWNERDTMSPVERQLLIGEEAVGAYFDSLDMSEVAA